ncbi:MAG: hypothetical protein ABIQ06_11945 [Caldimonas sp.]
MANPSPLSLGLGLIDRVPGLVKSALRRVARKAYRPAAFDARRAELA